MDAADTPLLGQFVIWAIMNVPPYLWFLAMFKQGCDIVISTMKEKQLKSTRRLHRPQAVTFTRQPLLSPSSATGMNRLALVVYPCTLTPALPENTVKTE